ncbi:MAG: DUF1549 domain-containing protein, partial [Planctomycetaceae bacterium]
MNRMACLLLFVSALVPSAAFAADEPAEKKEIDFAHDVVPVIREKCVRCHSVASKKGGLSFDNRSNWLKGGESGPAVIVGEAAKSLLIARLTTDNAEERMPLDADPLTDKEIGLLKRWIDGGLTWESGFSFSKSFRKAPLKPNKPVPPDGSSAHLIDRWLDAYWIERGIDVPDVVDDRLFARRVHLDLIGLLPSPGELDEFLADADPHKRQRLVRRLLDDRTAYSDHWLTFWNDALRNDYFGPGYIDNGRSQITRWLYQALYENKPYDRFVTELVTAAPGAEGFTKGIIWRGVVNASQRPEMQAAQNLSQVFLGTNLKCASCHDSFVNHWKLNEAYAFAAIFSEGPLEIHHCDKPTGEIAAVGFLYPELGAVAPQISKAERLRTLAGLMTHPDNGRFSRTLVNRMWKQLLGRGIVEPVDNLDAEPWHNDLLDSLAVDFVEHGYDMQHLLELIATSRAYQLPSQPGTSSPNTADEFVFQGPSIKRMTAEQFVDAVSTLTGRWQTIAPVMFQPDGRGQGGQLAAVSQARGGTVSRLNGEGKWIWSHKDAGQLDPGGRIYLRKDIELDRLPTRASAVLTADNEYILYVNGQKVAASENWSAPIALELTSFLVKGTNRIAVEAANWPDTSKNKGLEHKDPNPAGFRFYAAGWQSEELSWTLESDESWHVSATELPDWQTADIDAEKWTTAKLLAGNLPWDLTNSFALIADPALTSHVRASLVQTDNLLRALGRPGREQVVTQRDSLATTLEALELTNGAILSEQLKAGAIHWLAMTKDLPAEKRADALLDMIYKTALGRSPTALDMGSDGELIGTELDPEH